MWGNGKIQIAPYLDKIREQLDAGYPVSAIYRELSINDLSYRQFHRLVRQYQKNVAESRLASLRPNLNSARTDRPVGAIHTRHSSKGHSTDRHSSNKRAPSFKHNPLPQKDYFASSSKAKGGTR